MSWVARAGAGLLRSCTQSARSSLEARVTALASSSGRKYATTSDVIAFDAEDNRHKLVRTDGLFKTFKPITPGIRHLKQPLNDHLWRGSPVRQLTVAQRKTGGRNNHGRITVRGRGGGHKRRIRLVDFYRLTPGPHDVIRVEYDPGRSAHIALIKSRDPDVSPLKKWSYILAPEGLRAGHVVQSFREGIPDGFVPGFTDLRAKHRLKAIADGTAPAVQEDDETASLALGVLRTKTIQPGNVLPLRLLPTGTIVHNISLKPEGRGLLVRSAGSFAMVVAHEEGGRYAHVRLQSGEVRKILEDCCATIGKVSNPLWRYRNLAKAGRSRWLGRRPQVRGVAMNASVSPHLFDYRP
jgi:ribosomal protein L2